MRQSPQMDWVSGITGAAAGASAMLSLSKLWASLKPKAPAGLSSHEREYFAGQLDRIRKALEELYRMQKDMDKRITELEAR